MTYAKSNLMSPSAMAYADGAAVDRKPRRFWQVVVLLSALLFVVGSVLMVTQGLVSGLSLTMAAYDLIVLLALSGYAWRRPLRGAALQILVLLMSALCFFRVAFVAWLLWPNLVPWRGDAIAWQALGTYVTLPLGALLAFGLYRYATDRSHSYSNDHR